MKLDSKECRDILKVYSIQTRSDQDTMKMEKLAIEVLTTNFKDVVNIPGIKDMNNDQINELAQIIKNIRNDIGIEDEA